MRRSSSPWAEPEYPCGVRAGPSLRAVDYSSIVRATS